MTLRNDVERPIGVARLLCVIAGTSLRRRVAALCLGIGALTACTNLSEASVGEQADDEPIDRAVEADDPPEPEVPLPTIGLGSDAGSPATGDVDSVDVESVDSIVMIGDSITVASTPMLEQQFAEIGFTDVEIVAQDGKRISESFGDNASGVAIAELVATDFDGDQNERLWIVALGTNDIGNYSDVDEVRDVIDSVLASVPDDAPLIWIDTYVANEPEDTASLNALIEAAIAQRGNAAVGHWSDSAPNEGVLRADGVHPNDQGAITFASVVTSTAANFLQR